MPKPLIEAAHLSKSYGLQHVLTDVSFLLSEGQKIALIGRNGSGKSTLLRILLGQEESDTGTFHIHPHTRIGVIEQNKQLPSIGTVSEYLEASTEQPAWKVAKYASRFGLATNELESIPTSLSGGYQMRVHLTKMALHDPNLLILDEPVNYLDLQTILFLEKYLQDYKGAFVLVAHDRTFLEQTCNVTFELERGSLSTFNGSVATYLDEKFQQREFRIRENKRLEREIAHNQQFVDRFRYKASLATRAQNKLKHIARLEERIHDIPDDLSTISMQIPSLSYINGIAISVEDLVIGYPEHEVARDILFDITRGEKVVIAGQNGQGKTTLLKTLVQLIEPLQGDVSWWKHAKIGYYDQMTNDSLSSNDTVLQHLEKQSPKRHASSNILAMAGNFLFTGDDLEKPVSVLSGGERARLALAGILLQEHNVLILDEPTNHLDVETVEIFQRALQEYEGTIVCVSHVRSFVESFIDKVITVEHGRVRRYMGSYGDYVDSLIKQTRTNDESPTNISTSELSAGEKQKRIRQAQRQQERLMKQLDSLKDELKTIHEYFLKHPTEYNEDKQKRLSELNSDIPQNEEQWLELEQIIEELRS